MAHEITEYDQMLSVRAMPWHGLGHILTDHPTRSEAQALVHPWEPVTTQMFKRVPMITPDGELRDEYVPVDGSVVVERSDDGRTLGVVNESYGLVTNGELWDVVEAVGKIGTDTRIETAGSLRGGQDVWVLLRMDEPIMVPGDPNGGTVAFLAFQNNHIGLGAFRAQAVNTRIVCANTSSAADTEAHASGYDFTFRHTSKVSTRIEEAKAAVSMWREGIQGWRQVMDHLIGVNVTAEQREEFVQRFQPMPANHLVTDRVRANVEEARGQLREIFNSPTQEGISLTAYGLFQAGIEWVQHERRVRGKDDRARMESYFRRNMLDTSGLRRATLNLVREVALA